MGKFWFDIVKQALLEQKLEDSHKTAKEIKPAPLLEFKPLYREYKKSLGKPGPFQDSLSLSFDVYEKAKIIYIDQEHAHFLIDESTPHWDEVPDSEIASPEYMDENGRNIKSPGTPYLLKPPIGGIARKCEKNPSFWKERIGWLRWGCIYPKNLVRYQKFEHGLMVGPLPLNESDAAGRTNGQIFVLLQDDKICHSRPGPKPPSGSSVY